MNCKLSFVSFEISIECYLVTPLSVFQITFDNRFHSGKLKITLDIDAVSSVCKHWTISGTGMYVKCIYVIHKKDIYFNTWQFMEKYISL